MWPSVTNKCADRALTAALVAALALAHLGALMLVGPRAPGKPAVPTRISMQAGPALSRSPAVAPSPTKPKPTPARKPEKPSGAVEPEPAPRQALKPVAAPAASDAAAEPGLPDPSPEVDSAGGGVEPAGLIDVTAAIVRRLEERRVYPIAARRRGAEGDVVVRFTLRPDGAIASVAAESPEAHPLLRRAAVDSVVAAAPFPLPEGFAGNMEFAVTIAYRLSD